MLLSKSGIIPELDEVYDGRLIDILKRWEMDDSGGSILSNLHGTIKEYFPPLLKAYIGRKKHGDTGLFSLPRFGDHHVIEAMRRLDLSLSTQPVFLRGSFCVDLNRGVIGHWLGGEGPSSRDEYRSNNFNQTFVTDGTAIDFVRELTGSSYFEFRRLTTSDQARHLDFHEKLRVEDLQHY